MKILVTGSSGLVGSEAVAHFDRGQHEVLGMDNNMRARFFGPVGDTAWNLKRLRAETRRARFYSTDVRDRSSVFELFAENRPDAVVHCAAQPSHDLARKLPLDDFDVNAVGTINLLEATRRYVPESPFILLSTNKVYGDAPNEVPLRELATRWDYAQTEDRAGIDETCRIDRSLHSLFGVSKCAADLVTQEYGRTYGMPTVCFRAGCITGARHSGVELHGFLSHLVKTAQAGKRYTVFGYGGKQVRDNLHSADVVLAIEEFMRNPKSGAVYNLGGGRDNSVSILEAFDRVEQLIGRPVEYRYEDKNRLGDHICYVSDTGRFQSDYPDWTVTRGLDEIFEELVAAEADATSQGAPVCG